MILEKIVSSRKTYADIDIEALSQMYESNVEINIRDLLREVEERVSNQYQRRFNTDKLSERYLKTILLFGKILIYDLPNFKKAEEILEKGYVDYFDSLYESELLSSKKWGAWRPYVQRALLTFIAMAKNKQQKYDDVVKFLPRLFNSTEEFAYICSMLGSDPCIELATAFQKQGRRLEAKEILEKALNEPVVQDNPEVEFMLAEVYLELANRALYGITSDERKKLKSEALRYLYLAYVDCNFFEEPQYKMQEDVNDMKVEILGRLIDEYSKKNDDERSNKHLYGLIAQGFGFKVSSQRKVLFCETVKSVMLKTPELCIQEGVGWDVFEKKAKDFIQENCSIESQQQVEAAWIKLGREEYRNWPLLQSDEAIVRLCCEISSRKLERQLMELFSSTK